MAKTPISRMRYRVYLLFLVIGMTFSNLINRRYDDFFQLFKYARNSLK